MSPSRAGTQPHVGRGWVTAVAVVLGLALFPAQASADRRQLERYADTTWASFVAMTDAGSGLPTDLLHADGRREPQTSTTNIGAYMWSAVAAERLGIIGRARARLARMRADALDARADGAPRAERPVLQLVRPPHGREADDLARRLDGHADPVIRRQRLARHRPEDRRQQRARAVGARERDLRLDGLRLLLRAVAQPGPVPLRAVDRAARVLLRHGRLREPDRRLRRHREGRAAAQDLLRPLAQLPRLVRLVVAGDAAVRLPPQLRRRERLRRRVSVRRDARRRRAGAARCSRR